MTDIDEPPPPHETRASVARHPAAPVITEEWRIEDLRWRCPFASQCRLSPVRFNARDQNESEAPTTTVA
jgi:hypothetical protein